MSRIVRLDDSGHTLVEWDVANKEATAIASRMFNQLASEGNLMVETVAGVGSEQVRSFNPEAEEIVAIRQLAGG